MLKQRVLTALILLPLVMAAIFAAPAEWFLVILAVILLRGSWEYSLLAGLSGRMSRYSMVSLQAIMLAILFYCRDLWGPNALPYLAVSCALWLLMFIRLSRYRADCGARSAGSRSVHHKDGVDTPVGRRGSRRKCC